MTCGHHLEHGVGHTSFAAWMLCTYRRLKHSNSTQWTNSSITPSYNIITYLISVMAKSSRCLVNKLSSMTKRAGTMMIAELVNPLFQYFLLLSPYLSLWFIFTPIHISNWMTLYYGNWYSCIYNYSQICRSYTQKCAIKSLKYSLKRTTPLYKYRIICAVYNVLYVFTAMTRGIINGLDVK